MADSSLCVDLGNRGYGEPWTAHEGWVQRCAAIDRPGTKWTAPSARAGSAAYLHPELSLLRDRILIVA